MALATDRAVTDLAPYAPEQIGRTRYLTPEGFLYCEGVRIARTGPMMYAAAEMPGIEQGPFTSMITVTRDAEVLFAPETIASFAGKPVTNDHPPTPVTPANFKLYAVGVVLEPRRGEGADAEYLVADLLITEKDAIAAVAPELGGDAEVGSKPKVEVSAGYDLEVEQIKPGYARQTKNVGNHVALVDRARGGPALSIQDHHQEEPSMATRSTRRILDGIRKAFRAKDEAALETELTKAEEALDEEEGTGGGEPQTVVLKIEAAAPAAAAEAEDEDTETPADPYEARFKTLEDGMASIKDALEKMAGAATTDAETEEETPEEATDEEAAEEEKDADKAQAQDAMSKAEILSPGIKLPTMDAASGGLKNASLTDLRRRALKGAVGDSARKAHVDAVMGGQTADFDKMRPGQVRVVFDAAVAVAKVSNNADSGRRAFDLPQGRMTTAKMQERIEARRKERAGA